MKQLEIRGRDNYVCRVQRHQTAFSGRWKESYGGPSVPPVSLASWAAKRRRARQTHPGKRGKP